MRLFTLRRSSAGDLNRVQIAPHGCTGFLVLLLATFAPSLQAQVPTLVLRAKVFDVHDGDTIKVQLDSGPINVRLHGIDAPENNQARGPESRKALERLVAGKEVELEPVGQESYERVVAIVHVGDVSVNAQMIRDGEAWASRRYLRKKEDTDWCSFENAAQERKLGLWTQSPNKWIDPREWYHRKKRGYRYTDYSGETTKKCVASRGKK